MGWGDDRGAPREQTVGRRNGFPKSRFWRLETGGPQLHLLRTAWPLRKDSQALSTEDRAGRGGADDRVFLVHQTHLSCWTRVPLDLDGRSWDGRSRRRERWEAANLEDTLWFDLEEVRGMTFSILPFSTCPVEVVGGGTGSVVADCFAARRKNHRRGGGIPPDPG